MTVRPRRKITELLAFYKLNPRVKDLFVEGPSDKAIFSKILDGNKPFGSSIYSDSDIEIDVGTPSGENGAKGRLIGLCSHLHRESIFNVIGFVDRDCEPVRNLVNKENIIYTLYTSIDFHVCGLDRLFEVFELYFQCEISDKKRRFIIEMSLDIYAIRYFAYSKKIGIGFPDFDKNVKIDNDDFIFEFSEFLVRLGSKLGDVKFWKSSESDILCIKQKFISNYIQCIHFHDLENIIRIVTNKKFSFGSLDALVRSQLKSGEFPDEIFKFVNEQLSTS